MKRSTTMTGTGNSTWWQSCSWKGSRSTSPTFNCSKGVSPILRYLHFMSVEKVQLERGHARSARVGSRQETCLKTVQGQGELGKVRVLKPSQQWNGTQFYQPAQERGRNRTPSYQLPVFWKPNFLWMIFLMPSTMLSIMNCFCWLWRPQK